MRYIALVHLLKQRKQAQKIIEFLPRNSKFVILKPRHTTAPSLHILHSLQDIFFHYTKHVQPTMSFWNWKWGMENAKNVIENWRRISNRIKKIIIKFHNNNSVLCLHHDNIVRSLSVHSITCNRTSILCILIFCMIKFPPLIGNCRDLSDFIYLDVISASIQHKLITLVVHACG